MTENRPNTMNQNPISPDDPRLTLYALQEMEPAERDEFEKLLQQDAAARQAVDEIRAMAATVTTALESEPAFAEPTAGRPLDEKNGKILRFPKIYFMISGLAAACFALFFVYWQQNRPGHETHQYVELDLAKVGSAEARKKESEQAADAGKQKSVAVALPVAPSPAPVPAVTMALGDASQSARQDEEIVLSPFTVDSSKDGYNATSTVTGSRIGTDLKDVGSVALGSGRVGGGSATGQIADVPMAYTAIPWARCTSPRTSNPTDG